MEEKKIFILKNVSHGAYEKDLLLIWLKIFVISCSVKHRQGSETERKKLLKEI